MDSSIPLHLEPSAPDTTSSSSAPESSDISAEIAAMQQVATVLEGLAEASRARVLEWAASRFQIRVSLPGQGRGSSDQLDRESKSAPALLEYEHFVDLYDDRNPSTETERGLVAAYWLQHVRGMDSFTSQAANDLLKEMGRGIGNIADTFSRLQKKSPVLIRQVSKSGRSKQARKTYKLTTAGTDAVRRMGTHKDP